MKKFVKYTILVLLCIFICASGALAASVSDVQALDQQVRDKMASLQSQTLTKAQTTKLTKAQKSYASLMGSSTKTASNTDTQRDSKITAFKATLSDSQKTAFEAFMPSQPTKTETKPAGTPPPKPADGTQPTKMTDTDRQAMESKRTAFVATLSDEQKKAFEEIFPAGQPTGQPAGQPTISASVDFSTLTSSKLTKMEKQLKSLLNTLNKI